MATNLPIIVDDNSGVFRFSGTSSSSPWILSTLVQWYKATSWYPSSATDTGTFVFPFEGTSVAFIGNTPAPPSSQTATVQIDSGTVFNITYDDPSPPTYKQWFQSPKLSDGKHTITVSNLAGTSIDFAIVNVGNQTPLTGQIIVVDNDSPSVLYSGHWSRNTNKFIAGTLPAGYPYGNSTHRSSTPGDTFTFRFTGTSVSIYGIFSWFNLGSLTATYTVDGTATAQTYTVTSSSPSYLKKDGEACNFLYYSLDSLSAGDHTVIVNITEANNQIFMLDYITYTPSFTTLSSMPLLNTTSTTASTTASTWLGSPSSQPSQAQSSSTPQPSPTAAIVGGVIGGLAFGVFVAILGTCLFLRRRRARQAENISQDLYASTGERNYQSDANNLNALNSNGMGQLRPQRYDQHRESVSPFQLLDSRGRYGWADIKYGRSNPTAQATDSRLTSSPDPPSSSDGPAAAASVVADPPSYDALSYARPVTKYIATN